MKCCRVLWFLVILTFGCAEAGSRRSNFTCHRNDLTGLADFKARIRSDDAGRLDTWTGKNCCKWKGISCNKATGRVRALKLPGPITLNDMPFQSAIDGWLSPSITLLTSLEVINLFQLTNLSGQIPVSIGYDLPNLKKLDLSMNNLTGPVPESIGKLSKLKELYLYDNSFSGYLPPSLSNLRHLKTLDLHSNQFTGRIPKGIGNLEALEVLDLSSNSLTRTIPVCVSNLTAITSIHLSDNRLEGGIPFPTRFGEMANLYYLRIENNRLTGRLPSSFGYLTSLERLYLSNNKLEGTIPSSFGKLSALLDLWLDGNRLTGQIPRSIGKLSRLRYLSLSHNMIQSPLPTEMSALKNLTQLYLSFNALNLSSVPKWFDELPFLDIIHLAGCGIEGKVPELFKSTRYAAIDLSSNRLTGAIPEWLGNLTNLYFLNLSRNSLVSRIPRTFKNFQTLSVLDLHSNNLTGPINPPFEMRGRFSATLTYLDLSENSFSDGIEVLGEGVQIRIYDLNLAHNRLKGRLPDSIGRLGSLRSLDLSYNEIGSNLPGSLANLTYLKSLKLQNNRFTGRIPDGFLKLTELKQLDLSNNLLVGDIPSGKPLSDFPKSSYTGNRGLCGKPLSPCKH